MSLKATANAIRAGNVLIIDDQLWIVQKTPDHIKPGKGPAYVQIEMKNLKTGTKINRRFKSGETIEKAYLERQEFQYLYTKGVLLVLMNTTNFEQVFVNQDIIGEKTEFLTDNMIVTT